ncbi:MAG: 30S ribosomal protein S12 methylthiotransferase RimO [Candidatus Omnitrophota bacterium]
MKRIQRYKIGVVSLGCPRNLVDSESIISRLRRKGYEIVDVDKADVAIVNTCAFIDDAKRESVGVILDLIGMKKEGRLKKMVVYGCLSQRYRDKLSKELPQVDAFVGRLSLNHEKERAFSLTPAHYAYLKICEGCINKCSYCIIPQIKGAFSSLDAETVARKFALLDQAGVKEVNIIGQDITAYGTDLGSVVKLPMLLRRLLKEAKNVSWIRLLYLYPRRINDELLDLIRDEPKICKYIDLPIQHINARILKLMRRNVNRKEILEIIEKIHRKVPEAAIRTSLIVGFPSETDKEFQELLDFIREAKFERMGAFIYSREEGTAAYNLPGQVPLKIRRERLEALMLQQQAVSRAVNRRFLGEDIDVLIDEKEKGRFYLGRTQYDAPEVDGSVYVQSQAALEPGDMARVKITDTLEYDLVGKAA